jgi:hypothetical protein
VKEKGILRLLPRNQERRRKKEKERKKLAFEGLRERRKEDIKKGRETWEETGRKLERGKIYLVLSRYAVTGREVPETNQPE